MSIRNLFLLGLILIFNTSCSNEAFLVHNGNMPSTDKISQISVGQTRNEVASILGSPSSISSFDGNTWIYMSSTLKKVAFFKPEELDRKVLSINFDDNGKVSKISNYDKNDGKNVEISKQQTISSGHEIGFFQKYFGGVGSYMPISGKGSGSQL